MRDGLSELVTVVVVVASLPDHTEGTTNFLKLHRVGDSARY